MVDLDAAEVLIQASDPAFGTVDCGSGLTQARWISTTLCTASGLPGGELEIIPDDGSWTWSVVEVIDPSDIVMTIEAGSEVTAGERLWIEVTVTNTSDKRAVWYGGGWDIPVRASLDPVNTAQPGDPATAMERPPQFQSGEMTVLEFLQSSDGRRVPRVQFQPEGAAGVQRDSSQNDDLVIHLFEPGQSITTRLGGLIQVGRDDVGDEFAVTATFHPRSPYGFENERLGVVPATATVHVLDPTERAAPQADALAAVTSDPMIETYLELTRLEDELPAPIVQTCTAEMNWAFGRWELWIESQWAFGNPLRVVYDPKTGSITDVRILAGNGSPSDDPDHQQRPFGALFELILR